MAWTTPRTWAAGEQVTDTLLNLHLRDNSNYLKTEADRENDCSVSDVTGSRALATEYQNSGTKIMVASVSVYRSTAGVLQVKYLVGASTPLGDAGVTRQCWEEYQNTPASGVYVQSLMFIPVSYYYKIAHTNGTLNRWVEYTLH